MQYHAPLPWRTIHKEVIRAVNEHNDKRRFVNCKWIADYIHSNESRFPHFVGCTYQTTQSRVTTSFKQMGWQRFNRRGNRKAGVFIDPRVKLL